MYGVKLMNISDDVIEKHLDNNQKIFGYLLIE